MANKYDKKLNEILAKYGFCAEEIISSTEIHNTILDIFTHKCANKKVAIWGVGKNNTVNSHAAVIISKYVLNLGNLEYLIDSSIDLQGKDFMGYPIISPDEIKDKNIDIVIIGSRASAKAIINNLKEVAPSCEYIDIYEELKSYGIVIDYNFFSEQNMYTYIYQLNSEYKNAFSNDERASKLETLIKYYLKIRDFYYADKFIDVYISNKYRDYEKLVEMQKEITQLKEKIIEINSKKQGNVLVHLIDSLRAIDVYEQEGNDTHLKMFSDYEDTSVIFSNAYSTAPTTYESMLSIVKQKYPFEEDVYDNNFMFKFEEFELLSLMEKLNKKIIFYVARDYYIMEDSEKLERKEHLHMCEKLWSVACDIAQSDENIFGFIYYSWELHFPLLCGYLRNEPKIKHFSDVGIEDMSDFIIEQFEDCKDYVDIQLKYYKKLLGEKTINAFMGDHSQPVHSENKNWPYYMYYKDFDRVSHIAFFISGITENKKVYKQLISMIDFNKIMKSVLTGGFDIPNHELVEYQYYNIQNKKLREVAAKFDYWDYIEGTRCYLSDKYLYVITATGKEELYDLNNTEENIISQKDSKVFVEHIKKNCNTDFPTFWKVNFKNI